MSKSIVGGSAMQEDGFDDGGLTSYFSVVGATGESLTEAAVQFRYEGLGAGESAVFSKLSVYVNQNEQRGACTFSFMLNGVAEFTLSVPAGETGWFTSTGSATVANGDLIALRVVRYEGRYNEEDPPEPVYYFAFAPAHIQLEVTGSDYATWIIGGDPSFYVDADTEVTETRVSGRFEMTADVAATAVDEFKFRHKVRAPGVAQAFQCQVTDNDLDGAVVVTLLRNGAPTTAVLTITAATNGIFIDTTHPITLVDGDQLSMNVDATAAATGTCSIASVHLIVESATTSFDVVAAGGRTMARWTGDPGDNFSGPNIPIGRLVERIGG